MQTKQCVIIDSVQQNSDRDIQLIHELDLTLKYCFETHVHADHITNAHMFMDKFGAQMVLSKHAQVTTNSSLMQVEQGDTIMIGAHRIDVRETPGHTNTCLTYVVNQHNNPLAFTGDALLVRGCGRTDFQSGSATTLYRSVHEQIYTLPNHTIIYPGHDYCGHRQTTVLEEKRFNPRLNLDISKESFIGIMDNLPLAIPSQMDKIVSSNLRGGRPVILNPE